MHMCVSLMSKYQHQWYKKGVVCDTNNRFDKLKHATFVEMKLQNIPENLSNTRRILFIDWNIQQTFVMDTNEIIPPLITELVFQQQSILNHTMLTDLWFIQLWENTS